MPPLAVALVSSFYTSEPDPIHKKREQAKGTHVSTSQRERPQVPPAAAAVSGCGNGAESRSTSVTSACASYASPDRSFLQHSECAGGGSPGGRIHPSLDSHLLLNNGDAFTTVPMEGSGQGAPWPELSPGGGNGGGGIDEMPPFNEEEYAGGWHRAPKFGDAADADKK